MNLTQRNNGRNNQLMENCKPLAEYAWFVAKVRHPKAGGKVLRLYYIDDKAITKCYYTVVSSIPHI